MELEFWAWIIIALTLAVLSFISTMIAPGVVERRKQRLHEEQVKLFLSEE